MESGCEMFKAKDGGPVFRANYGNGAVKSSFNEDFVLPYAYAYALYCIEGEEGYKAKIGYVMEKAEAFFKTMRYFDSVLDESVFQKNKAYLIGLDNPKKDKYMVEGFKLKKWTPYVDEAFENVMVWVL